MNMLPEPCERLDDLQIGGLFLFQRPERFCFGMDAVLLSDFARVPKGGIVLDMCSGNGVIPVLLSAKTEAGIIRGVEILPENIALASKSVEYNGISPRVEILQGDIKDMRELFPLSFFDSITCNPPYMKMGEGLVNPADARAVARHEVCCTFEDVAAAAGKYLKPGGSFYLVHRPYRLPEIMDTLKGVKLEPKRLRMVHSYSGKEAAMVLLECVRNGKPYLKVEPPLIIYDAPDVYSKEIKRIYGGEE